jgi:hypothetical protein
VAVVVVVDKVVVPDVVLVLVVADPAVVQVADSVVVHPVVQAAVAVDLAAEEDNSPVP